MTKDKPKMVTAVFRNRMDAQAAYDRLMQRGYRNNEINVLMSEATRTNYFAHDDKSPVANQASTLATEGMGVGGAIGTAVGATVAAIMAAGTTLIIPPPIGIAVAGPLAAALAGGGAGAVTGGLIGALVGWGIPEPNANAYQEALRDGGVVFGVVPRNAEDAGYIKEDFEDLHGESICYC